MSNYVTTNGLLIGNDFGDRQEDPDNFRLQVLDPGQTAGSVNVEVTQTRPGQASVINFHSIPLGRKSGGYFRSDFLRLVSDAADASSSPNVILVQLGDRLTAKYQDSRGVSCTRTIMVGRPVVEEDNNTDQKKHDIREVKVRFVVFQKPDGSGPAITQARLDAEIATTNERLAQATIRLKVVEKNFGTGGTGVPIPATGPLSGLSNGFDISGFGSYSNDERELFASTYIDDDNNTWDVIYFHDLVNTDLDGLTYAQSANRSGDAKRQNVTVIQTNPDEVFSPYILPHEGMHVLLNVSHNPKQRGGIDPPTALFHVPLTRNKRVEGTKRIGLYPDAKEARVGEKDTVEMRQTAEKLPQ